MYGMANAAEITNVVVTGIEDGGNLLEKEIVESKMKLRLLAEGDGRIG